MPSALIYRRKEERRALGMESLKKGDMFEAAKYFKTCIDVTPDMAYEVIKVLRLCKVEYVVAPYEADAQLAYLNRTGFVDVVITEDSDLLTFGCLRVVYKLTPDGACTELRQKDLGNIKEMRNWTSDRFREMCVLAGCDYLSSPPGIAVKTAVKLLESKSAYTLMKSWKTWGSAVKAPKLPANYLESFQFADWTFQHQRVYDPETEILVPLNPFPPGFELTREISDAIGADLEPHIAKGIGLGDLDPISKITFGENLILTPPISQKRKVSPKVSTPQPPSIVTVPQMIQLNSKMSSSQKSSEKSKIVNGPSKPSQPKSKNFFTKSKTPIPSPTTQPIALPTVKAKFITSLKKVEVTTSSKPSAHQVSKHFLPKPPISVPELQPIAIPTTSPSAIISLLQSEIDIEVARIDAATEKINPSTSISHLMVKKNSFSLKAAPKSKVGRAPLEPSTAKENAKPKSQSKILNFFRKPVLSPFFPKTENLSPEKRSISQPVVPEAKSRRIGLSRSSK